MTTWVPAMPAFVPGLLLVVGLSLQLLGVFALSRVRVPAPSPETPALPEVDVVPHSMATLSVVPPSLPAMVMPIVDARVPTSPASLPGARRSYRGGVHEGVDFRCAPGTPVRAVLDGYVLSIQDGPTLPRETRNELLAHCTRTGQTPGVVLDVLHGTRIVLCHGVVDGHLLTTSYSHLERIREVLAAGTRVEAGEVIASAGNTGTSHAYANDGWAELHFEIRLDGVPIGQGLSPREAGAMYRAAFEGVCVP